MPRRAVVFIVDFICTRLSLWYYVPPPSESFLVSTVEFWPLYILRTTLVAWSIFFKGPTQRWQQNATNAVAVTTMSYAIGKLVVFIHEEGTYWVAGPWILLIWHLTASLKLYLVVRNDYNNARRTRGEKVYGDDDSDDEGSPKKTSNNNNNNNKDENLISFWEQIVVICQLFLLHKRNVVIAGIFFFINSIANAFTPYYSSEAMQSVVTSRSHDIIIYYIKMMVFVEITASITRGLYEQLMENASARVVAKVNEGMFSSLIRRNISFYDEHKSGEIVAKINSCESIEYVLGRIMRGFSALMDAVTSVVFMCSICVELSCLSMISVPMTFLINTTFIGFRKELYHEQRKQREKKSGSTTEAFGAMRTVRAFACEDVMTKLYEKQSEEEIKSQERINFSFLAHMGMDEVVEKSAEALIMGYAGYLALTGKIPGEVFMTFVLYKKRFLSSVDHVKYSAAHVIRSLDQSRKALSYVRQLPELTIGKGKCTDPITGRIELQGISFSYPSRPNEEALSDVSFTIEPGQCVALVGPSGSGKSSIVGLLQGFYEPCRGEILVDGRPISEYDHKYYHRMVSLVSQEPTLFDCTIKENICFGLEDISDDEVVDVTKMVNAYEFIMKTEKGFDTKCGEHGVKMSGGQKQRIAIARAIIRSPSFLILDEATSALDTASEHIVQQALDRCSMGRSSLVIAHRLSTIAKADKIIVLDKGRIVQSGSHALLMEDKNGLYYDMVQKQTANLVATSEVELL